MVKIAVVYHSGYGHTEVQAKRVVKGAQEVDNTEVELFHVEAVTDSPEKLNDYDAIIFGSPTYMGSVSAPFKAFMEASSKIWMSMGWKDKIAAGFTNSGSMSGDKFNTLVQMATLASQHGMIWVSLGLMNESGANDMPSGDPSAINRIGSSLGAMAQSDNLPPEQTPPEGDLQTAQLLGQRVAEATHRWKA